MMMEGHVMDSCACAYYELTDRRCVVCGVTTTTLRHHQGTPNIALRLMFDLIPCGCIELGE